MSYKFFSACSALLVSAMLLSACGEKNASSSDASSAASSGTSASSASSAVTSMPETAAEIMHYNDVINPDDIRLLQYEAPAADTKYATIKTDLGDVKLLLFPTEAPKAVENFTKLVGDGFYDGMRFFEVIPDVRVGAGATDASGKVGKSATGTPFEDEFSLNLWHFNGAVAMNNGGESDQNDSRFYIVQNAKVAEETIFEALDGGFPQKVIDKYVEVGGVPNYDFRDTVFAQVVEGMDVVQKIAAVETDALGQPKTDVKIISITLS